MSAPIENRELNINPIFVSLLDKAISNQIIIDFNSKIIYVDSAHQII